MNFAKAEIIKQKEVPKGRNSIDYTPLFRKVAAMVEDDDAIRIPIEKGHYVTNIQNALDKEFGEKKFKTFQRSIDNQMYCIIVKR